MYSTSRTRRAFLQGLTAAGIVIPAGTALGQSFDTYTGQPIDGNAPAPPPSNLSNAPERNMSSFRSRHWREFYPTLGKGVILADVTSRALYYWSADETVNFVFPCSIPMTEDLTRRGQAEIVRKVKNPPGHLRPACVKRTQIYRSGLRAVRQKIPLVHMGYTCHGPRILFMELTTRGRSEENRHPDVMAFITSMLLAFLRLLKSAHKSRYSKSWNPRCSLCF